MSEEWLKVFKNEYGDAEYEHLKCFIQKHKLEIDNPKVLILGHEGEKDFDYITDDLVKCCSCDEYVGCPYECDTCGCETICYDCLYGCNECFIKYKCDICGKTINDIEIPKDDAKKYYTQCCDNVLCDTCFNNDEDHECLDSKFRCNGCNKEKIELYFKGREVTDMFKYCKKCETHICYVCIKEETHSCFNENVKCVECDFIGKRCYFDKNGRLTTDIIICEYCDSNTCNKCYLHHKCTVQSKKRRKIS